MRCFEIINSKVVVKTEIVRKLNSLQPNEVNTHHLPNLFISPSRPKYAKVLDPL